MQREDKSYVDKLDARNPLDFNLLRISPECLIDQNIFFTIPFINCCTIFYNIIFNRSEARCQK